MSDEDCESDSEDVKPFDEAEAAMAKTCTGCGRTIKAGDPPLARCSECLTSRFCNRECQKKAWPYHKRACGPMAQIKLNHLVAELTANKQDFCSLIEEVRVHICAHGTLPDKLTEKQLDNLTSLWRCAYAWMPTKQQLDRLKVLTVANLYALSVPRPAHRLEMIIRDTKAVVAALPSAVDEVGSILWGAKHVYWVCLYGGNLMAQSGRPREAVDFAQSVKPNLEVCLLSLAPESNGSSSRGLLTFLKAYAHWLRECSPPGGCVDEFRANPDRTRMVAVLKQIITLGKKLGEDQEVAWCYSRLGSAYLEIEEYDKAVEALQRCLKMPWSEWSAPAACTAVESLVASRRDVQAGKWVDQFLRLESLCPGRVGALEQATLVQWQGLLLARRGRYDEAVDCVRRAEDLLKLAATTQPGEQEGIDKLSEELVLDRLDYLEEAGNIVEVRKIERRIGPFAALRRPLTFVREIERRPEVFMTTEVKAIEELIKPGNYYDWRRQVKGAGMWAMRLLERLRTLTLRHCPEGEQKDAVLAKLQARIAKQEEAERRGAEQMRAQMMHEVRKEVTGKGPAEASKAGRKKRKKRKKKSMAQAREGEEQEEEEEEELEQQMEGLDLNHNGESEDKADDEVQQEAAARDECVICLNELNEQGEEEEELACGHVLHASCLRCWSSKCTSLRIEVTCPVCRVAIVQDSSN